MKFSEQRKKKMSDSHKDLMFNPKLTRRENKYLRGKGLDPSQHSKKSVDKLRKQTA